MVRAVLAAGVVFSMSGLGAYVIYLFLRAFLTDTGLNLKFLRILLLTAPVTKVAGFSEQA